MTQNLAIVPTTGTAVATTGHLEFSRAQIDLIKAQCAQGTSDDEFQLFVEVCKMRGLNPMAGQMYAIVRNDKKSPTGKKMTIQVGIDGYRAIAERTGEADGSEGPYWCGADGEWKDVWLSADPPAAARVVIHRKGRTHGDVGIALWSEYAPYRDEYSGGNKTGKKALDGLWGQRPAGQLAKCATALALRAAFPQDLSGIYTNEEMDQADTRAIETTASEAPKTPGQRTYEAILGLDPTRKAGLKAWANGNSLTVAALDGDAGWRAEVDAFITGDVLPNDNAPIEASATEANGGWEPGTEPF